MILTGEVWRDVVGYEPYFSVSNYGRVTGKRSGKILKTVVNKQGRESLSSRIGGRSGQAVCFKVHRIVAEAFIENIENKPTVNHIDGNPLNNSVSNLEWATISENIQHAFDTGLKVQIKGSKNTNSTLTSDNVDYIRRNPHDMTLRELGEMFGVHHCTIQRCKSGKRYMPD